MRAENERGKLGPPTPPRPDSPDVVNATGAHRKSFIRKIIGSKQTSVLFSVISSFQTSKCSSGHSSDP